MDASYSNEKLWSAGLAIVGKLRGEGHEAFLVGGCVRDRLLGRELHDVDIATSALPPQVMSIFPRTLPTGLQHGTVTVMNGGIPFEVTTFRHEEGYTDARRPDRVSFVQDVREDLARRDFTINAMAVGVDGAVVDPFDGRADLAAGIVRCVGDAEERFGEDALRMLRALRFAAELDFRLTLSVWRAIRSQRDRLRQVAMERVASEWDKMMGGARPDKAAALLVRSGLLRCAKEKLPQPIERLTWSRAYKSADALVRLGNGKEGDVRWSAFLFAAGCTEEDAAQLCRILRFSSRRIDRIAAAVGFARKWQEESQLRAWVNLALRYGRRAFDDWTEMRKQLQKNSYEAGLDANEAAARIDSLQVWTAKDLAVRGNELSRELGRAPGPWVASALRALLLAVALGELPNEREPLLRAGSEWTLQDENGRNGS